jgi:hypothetical protein
VARDRGRARAVYERALSALEGEPNAQELYIKFAQFEEYAQEFEARPARKTASEMPLPIRAERTFCAKTAMRFFLTRVFFFVPMLS